MTSIPIMLILSGKRAKTINTDPEEKISALLDRMMKEFPNENFSNVDTFLIINEIIYDSLSTETLGSIGIEKNHRVKMKKLVVVDVPATSKQAAKTLPFKPGTSSTVIESTLKSCNLLPGHLLSSDEDWFLDPSELQALPPGRYKISYQYGYEFVYNCPPEKVESLNDEEVIVVVPGTVDRDEMTLKFPPGVSSDDVDVLIKNCDLPLGQLLSSTGKFVLPDHLKSLPAGRYQVSYDYVPRPASMLPEPKEEKARSFVDIFETETVQAEEQYHQKLKSNPDEEQYFINEFEEFLNRCLDEKLTKNPGETLPILSRILVHFGLGPHIDSILVRKPYYLIAHQLLGKLQEGVNSNKYYKGLVTGTAGCGKSYFLIYLLSLLSHMKGLEIIRLDCSTVSSQILTFKLIAGRWVFSKEGVRGRPLSKARYEVTLIDPEKGRIATHLAEGHTIVCCSAALSHFNSMMTSSYDRYYMPAFSFEELQNANACCLHDPLTEDQLEVNYDVWGGIARYTLDKNISPMKVLEARLLDVDVLDLLSTAAKDNLIPRNPALQGVLINLVPTVDSFQEATRDFTSKVIENKLMEKLQDNSYDYQIRYCIENQYSPFVGGVRGKMFERVLKYYFVRKRELSLPFIRLNGNQSMGPKEGIFLVRIEDLLQFTDLPSLCGNLNDKPHTLHNPKSKTFPTLDFIFFGEIEGADETKKEWLLAGQSTISSSHQLDTNGARIFHSVWESFHENNQNLNHGVVFLTPSTTNLGSAQSFHHSAESTSKKFPAGVTQYQEKTLEGIPQFVVKFDLSAMRLEF